MSISGELSKNLNHVANLDKSLAMSLSLAKSNMVLKVGSAYSAVATLSVYDRLSGTTALHTVNQVALTSLNLSAYMAAIKTSVELAYPSVVVTATAVNTTSSVATFSAINIAMQLSGSQYYLRSFNVSISLAGIKEYDVNAALNTPAVHTVPTVPVPS